MGALERSAPLGKAELATIFFNDTAILEGTTHCFLCLASTRALVSSRTLTVIIYSRETWARCRPSVSSLHSGCCGSCRGGRAPTGVCHGARCPRTPAFHQPRLGQTLVQRTAPSARPSEAYGAVPGLRGPSLRRAGGRPFSWGAECHPPATSRHLTKRLGYKMLLFLLWES